MRVRADYDLTGQSEISTDSDRKSTRLNSSHTVIYTLSLHDALPIWLSRRRTRSTPARLPCMYASPCRLRSDRAERDQHGLRSEEHTSELQSHSDLHSFPTRRSSDLVEPTPNAKHPSTPAMHVCESVPITI